MEEANRHGLGPRHPVKIGGLEAHKVDVLSGDLLFDLLHGCKEPLITSELDRLVPVICRRQFEISEKKNI